MKSLILENTDDEIKYLGRLHMHPPNRYGSYIPGPSPKDTMREFIEAREGKGEYADLRDRLVEHPIGMVYEYINEEELGLFIFDEDIGLMGGLTHTEIQERIFEAIKEKQLESDSKEIEQANEGLEGKGKLTELTPDQFKSLMEAEEFYENLPSMIYTLLQPKIEEESMQEMRDLLTEKLLRELSKDPDEFTKRFIDAPIPEDIRWEFIRSWWGPIRQSYEKVRYILSGDDFIKLGSRLGWEYIKEIQESVPVGFGNDFILSTIKAISELGVDNFLVVGERLGWENVKKEFREYIHFKDDIEAISDLGVDNFLRIGDALGWGDIQEIFIKKELDRDITTIAGRGVDNFLERAVKLGEVYGTKLMLSSLREPANIVDLSEETVEKLLSEDFQDMFHRLIDKYNFSVDRLIDITDFIRLEAYPRLKNALLAGEIVFSEDRKKEQLPIGVVVEMVKADPSQGILKDFVSGEFQDTLNRLRDRYNLNMGGLTNLWYRVFIV
ncbi:MAG: hypothetical protein KAU03_02675, partial [Candidatus Altiarchaeales archaeon]|nr:hypothetical protein [Candidatus Altiarchaeales archaeon]